MLLWQASFQSQEELGQHSQRAIALSSAQGLVDGARRTCLAGKLVQSSRLLALMHTSSIWAGLNKAHPHCSFWEIILSSSRLRVTMMRVAAGTAA